MSKYLRQAIKRQVGKALHEFGMITDGDRIAVGLSGGKDSMTLMYALSERLKRIPISYELTAVYVDPGFDGGFAAELESYCTAAGYRLRIDYSDCGVVAHSPVNRENPCFLCARSRRKRLFELTRELGCTKLALGHHKDDLIETLFINMCYAGEISTMRPVQALFDGALTIIRPLSFLEEDVIRRFAAAMDLPVFKTACPSAETSKRNEIKQFLNQLYRTNRKIRGNLFRSMSRVRTDYLLG
jgi:tRNA 2-thiocytidine biosynthesis protein TtcA